MRSHFTLAVMAAMAIGGFNFALRAADDMGDGPMDAGRQDTMGGTTRPSGGEQASGGNVQLPAGIQVSRMQNDGNVRDTLANIADSTLTKNDLGKLAKYIAQARTSNIGDLSKLSDNRLNKLVDKINNDWNNKYGKAFDASASAYNASGSTVRILLGEITNPAMLSNWPLQNKGQSGQGGQAGQPGGADAAHSEQALKGTDVAIVVFPAEHNLPEVTASLIKQSGSWKVEIPENITGQKFHDNLVKYLETFSNMSWPQNQEETYRVFTHHVLAALYDVQPQGGSMQPGSSEQPGQPTGGQPGENQPGENQPGGQR